MGTFLKGHVTRFVWTGLVSLFAFYAVDVNTWVYLIAVGLIWSLLLLRFSCGKSREFYRKTPVVFLSNFLAFVLSKYLHGYRLMLDAEDCVCILYCGALAAGCMLCLFAVKKNAPSEKEREEVLFRERKFDRDRLEEYLSIFSIIGVDGPWGSGKSFVTDRIRTEKYIPVKIDLLACNLDEIQRVLLNELDKVLKDNGIFSSYSPKLQKTLMQGGLAQNVGQLFVRDDVTYTEAIAGFQRDLDKLEKTILIVYEDLDRVESEDVIKKILGISEKLAGGKVKVIYQYDEANLREKGFDRRYLEKYIPFTIRLTELSFSQILDYWFEMRTGGKLPVERKDFNFLEGPVQPLYALVKDIHVGSFELELPNVTIRKVDHFLGEILLCMEKDGVYRANKREVILFFLIKHFYDDIYQRLVPGKSLLDIVLFAYQGRVDSILNWYRAAQQARTPGGCRNLFLAEENRLPALLVSLFSYHCDIYEVERDLEAVVNEPAQNIQKQYENEQKDRIIWSLLCSGKSEYTDQQVFARRLCAEVLALPPEQQEGAFERLWEDMYHGRMGEKGDNRTIALIGVPVMVSAFQACRVAGLSGEQWCALVDFYLRHKKIRAVTPGLIECLQYCSLTEKTTYLHILKQFNQLEITGNMNSHRAYQTFLERYLSALSVLGYVETSEVGLLRGLEEQELDAGEVGKWVLDPLSGKLRDLKGKIPIPEIGKEIDLLHGFLDQNRALMAAQRPLDRPRLHVTSEMRSSLPNQKRFDELNAMDGEEELFCRAVREAYEGGEITAYEIARLKRFAREEPAESVPPEPEEEPAAEPVCT